MRKKKIVFTCLIIFIVIAIYLIYSRSHKTSLSIDQYLPQDFDTQQQQELQDQVDVIALADNDFSSISASLDGLRDMYGETVVDYEFCEYIILEKFRNNSMKFTGTPSTSEYHTIIEECYVVYLVEYDTDVETDTRQWESNLEYLTSNYDVILETHKPNHLLKFYIDDYIEVYSNMLEEK